MTDIDVLRARLTTELYGRMDTHIERLEWDADRIADHQRDRLRRLLAHALERSPFHARRLRGIDPARFELSDLASLPVMTKPQMIDSFDEVVTDRRLGRELVEQHLAASLQTPSLLLDDYICLASGGSSGLRGIFVQTVEEFAEFGASVMRRAMAPMIAAGGPPPEGVVVALIGAPSPVHTTGIAAATSTGPVRYIAVPATIPLAEIVERLNALQPPLLMGYPSMLTLLARERQAGRLRIAPQAITATSEMSTAEDRAAIAIGFGVPIVNQFGATEGLVGHSDPNGDILTFASDTCIVELVDADNQPVPDGTMSAKVLVTNVHNFTQPLIRYELTDRLLRHPDAPEHGHLRATIHGQADDTLRYGDVEIHPLVIRTIMVKTPAVSEYQVRQTQQGIDVDVVADTNLDTAALTAALKHSLHKAGLPAPRADVHIVNSIARHPQTGKARRFITLRPQ